MKKAIFIVSLFFTISTNAQTLKEIVDVLGGKTERSSKKVMYKEVLNEVVTIILSAFLTDGFIWKLDLCVYMPDFCLFILCYVKNFQLPAPMR